MSRELELMDTPAERAKGLLKYKTKPSSKAAIFKLPLFGFFPLIHTFGMKFPIDVLFLSKDKTVCHIYTEVKPNRMLLPFRNLLGGCPYLIELIDCSLENIDMGTELSWEIDEAC